MSRGPKGEKRPPAAPLPAKRSPYKKRSSENQLPQISNNDGCKVGGTARDRMRRYRALAKECRAKAAKTKGLAARSTLIQFAQLCEILADGIEARLHDNAA